MTRNHLEKTTETENAYSFHWKESHRSLGSFCDAKMLSSGSFFASHCIDYVVKLEATVKTTRLNWTSTSSTVVDSDQASCPEASASQINLQVFMLLMSCTSLAFFVNSTFDFDKDDLSNLLQCLVEAYLASNTHCLRLARSVGRAAKEEFEFFAANIHANSPKAAEMVIDVTLI